MSLRADLSRFELVHTDELPWAESPGKSVFRKRLEHWGPPEAGRVTSVVRYAPGSTFPSHPHPAGEEILVIEGVFSDEHGDYPAGTFAFNPEGFVHAPRSPQGCTLFVKLRQMPGPRRGVNLQTGPDDFQPTEWAGVSRRVLYQSVEFPERVHLTRFEPGVALGEVSLPEGEEIFVLEGGFEDERESYRAGTWARFPAGFRHRPRSAGGCTFYVKQGHLEAAARSIQGFE